MTLALALAAAAGATSPARLSLYLQLHESPRRSIRWRMGGLALRGGGWWRELAGGPWEVDSAHLGEGQLLLGCFVLRPGRYDALRLRALKASLRREGHRRMLALDRPRVELPLPRPLELRGGDSVCLFLEWDVDASLREGFLFRPCLRVRLQRPPLRGELLYVTCDDIGTLYVVGANANRVVAALGVGPCPRGLLLDPEGNRLYVVDSRDRAVRVVELSTNRVVDSLALPATLEPTFLERCSEGPELLVTDPGTDYLCRLDLRTGSVLQRVRIGRGLYYPRCLGEGLVAISSRISQRVLLVDAEGLGVVGSIDVGGRPEGLLAQGGRLYVAEGDSDTVAVVDLREGRLLGRVRVGPRPRRLITDGRRIYVSNFGGNTVSVLFPGQMAAFRRIPVGDGPLGMALCPKRGWLYVLNRRSHSVTAIELASDRPRATIPLGGSPFQAVVLQ